MLQERGETEHPLSNDKFNTQKFSFIEKFGLCFTKQDLYLSSGPHL